jgi:hypothetical protein
MLKANGAKAELSGPGKCVIESVNNGRLEDPISWVHQQEKTAASSLQPSPPWNQFHRFFEVIDPDEILPYVFGRMHSEPRR